MDLVDLWNRAFPPPFAMDLRLWRQNTVEHPSFDPAGLLVETAGGRPVGMALVRVEREGSWLEALAVDPAYRRQGLGSRLLEEAARAGPGWLRLGAGPAHFFPGLPDGPPEVRRFFENRGFRADWEARDLLLREPVGRGLPAEVEPCPPEAAPALLAFLEAEFSPRWLGDTRRRLEIEGHPGDVLVVREGSRVLGFCHVYHGGSRVLGPSVYWRAAMPAPWGGLGPVGVAAAARGRGLGRALVEGAVALLAARGCRSVGVDWTGIPDFYRRLGFADWIRYTGMARP